MERKNAINSIQKDMLIEFMKNHYDLQTGRFSNEFTFKKAEALWEEITSSLNRAQKNWRQWRKTWQDLKKNVKSKAVGVKKHATVTGGGEPAIKPLSDMENEILQIINPTQINGLNIAEPQVIFDLNKGNQTENSLQIGAVEYILENETQPTQTEAVDCIVDFEQPSTSKIMDHEYSIPSASARKIDKTRLSNSLKISNTLLNSVEKRNSLLDEYYKEKIKYLGRKSEYLEKKYSLQSKTLSELTDIKNLIKEYFK